MQEKSFGTIAPKDERMKYVAAAAAISRRRGPAILLFTSFPPGIILQMSVLLATLKKYQRIWGPLAALLFLALCVYDLDFNLVWSAIQRVHYGYLVPSVFSCFIFALLRSQRWRMIIDPRKPISRRRIFRLFMIGQLANAALPALTGQAVRIWLLSKKEGLTKTFAFTTVVLEVVFDALSLLLLLAGFSSLLVLPRWLVRGELAVALGITVLFVLFYFFLRERPPVWMEKYLITIPAHRVKKLNDLYHSVSSGLAMLKSTRHLFSVFGLSLLAWLAQTGTVFFLMEAFGLEAPLEAALLVIVINTVALIIPITPGNVGTFQLACTFALSLFAVPKAEAFSFSVLLQVVDLLPVVTLGVYFLVAEHLRVRDLKSAEVLEYRP